MHWAPAFNSLSCSSVHPAFCSLTSLDWCLSKPPADLPELQPHLGSCFLPGLAGSLFDKGVGNPDTPHRACPMPCLWWHSTDFWCKPLLSAGHGTGCWWSEWNMDQSSGLKQCESKRSVKEEDAVFAAAASTAFQRCKFHMWNISFPRCFHGKEYHRLKTGTASEFCAVQVYFQKKRCQLLTLSISSIRCRKSKSENTCLAVHCSCNILETQDTVSNTGWRSTSR